jgi:hypothetical protein
MLIATLGLRVVRRMIFMTALEALRGIDREGLKTLEQSPQAVTIVIGPSGEIISDCPSSDNLRQMAA